jgi:hypothetical protein
MPVYEAAGSLLEPDIMLPEQYFAAAYPPSLSPERRLMLAVLEEAVLTLLKHCGNPGVRPQRLAKDAKRWFAACDSSWPFSFENICSALHFDPDYIRRGVLTLAHGPAGAASGQFVISLPFARRVAGHRHKVGLLLPHRKAAG